MSLTVVKGEVINNKKSIIPFTVGDWEMVISFEEDKDGVILTEVVCDGKNQNGSYFRAAKTPTNMNWNFNKIDSDFELCQIVSEQLLEAIGNRFELTS
jgi:hypothetical protein